MKRILFFTALAFILQSCYKSGELRVTNNISSVKMHDIYWGDIYLGDGLLPSETTEFIEVRKADEKLPSAYPIEFVLAGNGSEVSLRTVESYRLEEDGSLTIVIDDATEVR